MADNEVDIKIKVNVEGDKPIKTLGDLKKAIREAEDEMVKYQGTNQEAFDEANAKAGELKDRLGDIKSATKNLSGEPIKNLTKSFGSMGEAIRDLDIEGFKNSFGAFKTSIMAMAGTVMPAFDMSLGKTKFALDAVKFSLAAIGIGAIVILVVALIQNFDDLAGSGGALGMIFTALGDGMQWLKDKFLAFTDAMHITDSTIRKNKEALKENEKQMKENQKVLDETAENYAKVDEENKKRVADKQKRDQEAHDKWLKQKQQEREELEKHNKVISDLEDKYFDDERTKLEKKYKADLALVRNSDVNAHALRLEISKQGEAALKAFDDKVIEEKKKKKQEDDDAIQKLEADHQQKLLDIKAEKQKLQDEVDAQAKAKMQEDNAMISTAVQGFSDILGSVNSLIQQNHQQAIEAMEQERNKQLEVIDIQRAAKEADLLKSGLTGQALKNAQIKLAYETELAKWKINEETRKKELEAKKKAFKQDKAIKLTQAAIGTALGIVSALNNAFPLNIIMAALAAITGGIQIAMIAKTKFPEGDGAVAAPTPPTMPSPDTGALNGGGGQTTPTFQPSSFFGLGQNNLLKNTPGGDNRVYVVESDITNTQNRVRTTESRSTLGG